MNSSLFHRCLFALIMLAFSTNLKASHLNGGGITYKWVSNNEYLIRATLIYQCGGAPSGVNIGYASSTCSYSGTAFLTNLISSTPLVSVCPSMAGSPPCYASSGAPVFAEVVLEGLVTLPFNCPDWIFSYEACCRSGNETNVVNSAASELYFYSFLNNLNVTNNNSPSFQKPVEQFIYNNMVSNMNYSCFDIDGDSLVYELAPALDFISVPVSLIYSNGYSFLQPVSSGLPNTLSTNGILTVQPNALQISLIKVKVKEYRQGILIGEISKESPVSIIAGINNPISISGINGTIDTTIAGCAGDTLKFDVFVTDPDTNQGSTIGMTGPPTTAFIQSTANNKYTFTWVTDSALISTSSYDFTITAYDNHCPYNSSDTKIYHVNVVGCSPNPVWPGDANSDGVANIYDILPLAVAFNNTGPLRPSATINWSAQSCPDWAMNFNAVVNYKHADCDGNGTVNYDDTLAIYQNYGLSHPLRIAENSIQNASDLTITSNYDTVGTTTAVNFDISLTTPVDSLYGIAFRIYLDPALVDISSAYITYTGSIFGTNGIDMIKMDRAVGTSGFFDIAISRNNQQNFNGMGFVATLSIVTSGNLTGIASLLVEATDIQAITSGGNPVLMNSVGTSVVIDPNFVGTNEITSHQLSIHPIPAKDVLYFEFDGTEHVESIKICDLSGKEVLHFTNPGNRAELDFSELSSGMYYLKAKVNGEIIVKKIILF